FKKARSERRILLVSASKGRKPITKTMYTLQHTLLSAFMLIASFTSLLAQSPGGRRPPGGGPEEMISREKQALYEQVTDLTDDQKALLDGIYEELGTTLKETSEELRQSNDREARREKMEALREEKDELVADVLNEEQYAIYSELTSRRRDRRGSRTESNQPD
ncbi:MAG: hypothetical protein AAGE93_21240, partial [Bacteroidota bacterium]